MLVRTLACLCLLAVPAHSPAAYGRAAAGAPVDPRALALGGAGLALHGGTLSLRENPASSAGLLQPEIAVSHLNWLGGTYQDQLAASLLLGKDRVMSIGLGHFSVPEFDSTDGQAAAFSAGLTRVDLGYARQLQGSLGKLALGGAASYLEQRLGDLSSRALAASLGLAWKTPWPYLRLGAMARQIGAYSSDGSPLPMELGIGLGVEEGLFSLGLDLRSKDEEAPQLSLGAEWRPLRMLALRLGLSSANAPGAGWAPSAGLGLSWQRWSMAFAWQSLGALGPGMLVSLGTQWGAASKPGAAQAAKAAPPVPGTAPSERAARLPLPEKTARPSPVAASEWSSGDFELQAETRGSVVHLNWPQQGATTPKLAVYEVLMGMVPEAPLQRTAQANSPEPRWSEEMAVRGMTYYFRVRVLGQGGELLRISKVKAVQMP